MKNGRRLPKKFVEDQNFKWGMRLQERERKRNRGQRDIKGEGGREAFQTSLLYYKRKKKMRAPN